MAVVPCRTRELIRREGGVRLVAAARGRARQMNAGAAAATSDFLCFVHADTRPCRDLVSAIRCAAPPCLAALSIVRSPLAHAPGRCCTVAALHGSPLPMEGLPSSRGLWLIRGSRACEAPPIQPASDGLPTQHQHGLSVLQTSVCCSLPGSSTSFTRDTIAVASPSRTIAFKRTQMLRMFIRSGQMMSLRPGAPERWGVCAGMSCRATERSRGGL